MSKPIICLGDETTHGGFSLCRHIAFIKSKRHLVQTGINAYAFQ